MTLYKLSMSPDYVSHWGIQEAIREILANWLDSSGSSEYEIDEDEGYIELTNKDTTVPIKALVLGNSENRKDSKAVGSFGEGLKTALLVLVREGVEVTIRNGDKLWKPKFIFDETFGSQVLAVEETDGIDSGDYSVILEGLDNLDVAEAVDRCLYLQNLGETRECERGRVLMEESGKLYVGGIYICDLDGGHKYSYDFNPEYLPMNRDRSYAQHWDIKTGIARLLLDSFPVEEVKELITSDSQDTNYTEYCSGEDKFSEVAQLLYDELEKENGEDFVITENYADYQKYRDRGLNSVLTSGTIYTMVANYTEYDHDSRIEVGEEEEDKSPLEMLEEWYSEYEVDMRVNSQEDFLNIIEKFKERGVSWDD